jgi:hypothetical protein
MISQQDQAKLIHIFQTRPDLRRAVFTLMYKAYRRMMIKYTYDLPWEHQKEIKQEIALFLWKAMQAFNVKVGCFAVYFYWYIKAARTEYFRNQTATVKPKMCDDEKGTHHFSFHKVESLNIPVSYDKIKTEKIDLLKTEDKPVGFPLEKIVNGTKYGDDLVAALKEDAIGYSSFAAGRREHQARRWRIGVCMEKLAFKLRKDLAIVAP